MHWKFFELRSRTLHCCRDDFIEGNPIRQVDMVRITRVHTGGGDGGETSLLDGERVGKDHHRVAFYGTIDEVKAEVLDNINILNQQNRYILAPCHNIQAVSPPENIVAMYETAHERSTST